MLDQSNELTAWDRDHFFHPSTHMGTHARGETPTRVIAGGEGVYIIDINGRKSIDAFAGLYCVNVGYGRQKIADAIAAPGQEPRLLPRLCRPRHRGLDHAFQDDHRPRAARHVSRVYFGLSGSDANETNIKLIWYYNNVLGRPEKKKIISRWRGYHGSGVMTGIADRARPLPQRLRPAARADPAHRGALLFPPRRPLDERGAVLATLRRQARGDDPGRRPGHGRRLHRRADPRHRRHRAAARRLLAEDPGGARTNTTCCWSPTRW